MHAARADDDPLECPVCRAIQEARPVCRRCNADLKLFLRVIRSSRAARHRLEQAVAAGDAAGQTRWIDYLRWLHGRARGTGANFRHAPTGWRRHA